MQQFIGRWSTVISDKNGRKGKNKIDYNKKNSQVISET